MTFTPPAGSQISVLTTDIGAPTILIPVAANTARSRYAVALIAWLAIWIGALKLPVDRFYPDTWKGADPLLVTVALSVGWAVVGILVAWFLVKTLRPAVPASLKLAREGIDFDSGIQPARRLSDYFKKRIRRRIDLRHLKSLRLRKVKAGTRLTVHVGEERIEIARGATGVERDWLFGLLVDRYQLRAEA